MTFLRLTLLQYWPLLNHDSLVHCRSTDAEDIVRLQPSHADYIAMCGNKLEFQILPGSEQQVPWPLKPHSDDKLTLLCFSERFLYGPCNQTITLFQHKDTKWRALIMSD